MKTRRSACRLLAKKAASLFRSSLPLCSRTRIEFLDAGGAVDVVQEVVGFLVLADLAQSKLQSPDAAPQKGGVDTHDQPSPHSSATATRSATSALATAYRMRFFTPSARLAR
ncbi:MAG: hypothetical protein OXC08_15160 [Thiotrichales bacterium]|nr:hypothetical protein [Thiotrichales bacterium]